MSEITFSVGPFPRNVTLSDIATACAKGLDAEIVDIKRDGLMVVVTARSDKFPPPVFGGVEALSIHYDEMKGFKKDG